MKRTITLSITSFVGVAPGAKHYDPRIEESDNPIWDFEDGTWRVAWDDLDKCGAELRGPRCYSQEEAEEWILNMLRVFDPEKYVVSWLNGAPEDYDYDTFTWDYVPPKGKK